MPQLAASGEGERRREKKKGGKKLSVYLAFFLVYNFSVKNAAVAATIKNAGSSPILLPIVRKS